MGSEPGFKMLGVKDVGWLISNRLLDYQFDIMNSFEKPVQLVVVTLEEDIKSSFLWLIY